MDSKRLLPISIIILALSVVFGSIWIGISLEKAFDVQASMEKALMSETEAAEYLNISVQDFRAILLKNSQDKRQVSVYDTYRFIPYIEINNGNKMFSKSELDLWIKYNMHNK